MEESRIKIQEWIKNGNSETELNLSSLGLTSLPELPNNLQKLNCYNNKLTSLPTLPNGLGELYCGNNKLTELPILPNNLQKLNGCNNKLTSLLTLPKTLQELDCSENLLTSLHHLPNSLQILNCSENLLTSLPKLPNNLKQLYCSENQLTKLPTLPNSLQRLYCWNNKLIILPKLPNNLKQLYCQVNQLTKLPTLPNSLQRLYCWDNQLTSLPKLPNNLVLLYCYNNKLTNLPDLSQLIHLREVSCNNPNLHLTSEQLQLIKNLSGETPEELQSRINLGNIRMNQITTQNTELIKSTLDNMLTNNTPNNLNLPELDQKEQSVYKISCSNSNDLIGDKLDTRYGNVVIIDISNPDKYISYCFTYPEADAMWDYDKTYSIHLYLGYKINQRGVLLSKLYNTLVLRHINGLIYTLDPIPRRLFIREEKITPTTISNFQPTLDDINQYYLNDKAKVNIKLKTNPNGDYKIQAKFGTIDVESSNKINNIIKISDSISYKINGEIVNRIV